MDTLLKRLNGQAEIDLVGGNVGADIRQVRCLNGIQKDKKTQNFIVGAALGRQQAGIVLHILREIDLLRDPKVVHGLPVPVADPSVLHIVEVVEVGGIAADHAPQAHIKVALRVKEGLFLQFRHAILLMTSSFRSPRPQGPCCGHSKWS